MPDTRLQEENARLVLESVLAATRIVSLETALAQAKADAAVAREDASAQVAWAQRAAERLKKAREIIEALTVERDALAATARDADGSATEARRELLAAQQAFADAERRHAEQTEAEQPEVDALVLDAEPAAPSSDRVRALAEATDACRSSLDVDLAAWQRLEIDVGKTIAQLLHAAARVSAPTESSVDVYTLLEQLKALLDTGRLALSETSARVAGIATRIGELETSEGATDPGV